MLTDRSIWFCFNRLRHALNIGKTRTVKIIFRSSALRPPQSVKQNNSSNETWL